MSTYYSRSTNIELIVQSLRRLRGLCEGSNHFELSDAFVIRLKIMQHLAQLAFNYSLTVSYLDEQREYAPMADLLDDVYLQLPRKNLQYVSNDYRKIVSIEYDELRSVIDMMDERLKTIRVVCFNRKSCPKQRRQRSAKRNGRRMKTPQPAHWVDANRYRMRTPPNQEQPKPEEKEEEEPYHPPTNKRAVIYADYDSDDYVNHYNDRTSRKKSIRKYVSKMNSTKTAVESDDNSKYHFMPIEKAHIELYSHFFPPDDVLIAFKEKLQYYINTMGQYYNRSAKLYISNITERLFTQCKTCQELFEYVLSRADYISQHPRLRNPTNTVHGHSLMQILILKCVQLSNEINDKYDEIRKTQHRSNPGLRAVKSACLNIIRRTQSVLCKMYNEHRIEKKTLQELLACPFV
jgi:hypothetical protein